MGQDVQRHRRAADCAAMMLTRNVAEAWPSSSNRQRTRVRRYLFHIRCCTVLLIALSIGSFATMMADGTLVNTHLRAARCVNNDFHRDNPSDCNGMVVSFPTVVLISTVLCFATLASLLWIAVHLVDNNPCRAVHDISTMLVIFSAIKVTFMCLHGMFIAMTWYSELTDTRMLGFALLGADLTQILISGWIWLKLLQMQQVCTESEELTWTSLGSPAPTRALFPRAALRSVRSCGVPGELHHLPDGL